MCCMLVWFVGVDYSVFWMFVGCVVGSWFYWIDGVYDWVGMMEVFLVFDVDYWMFDGVEFVSWIVWCWDGKVM